jgi:hypothetical protein
LGLSRLDCECSQTPHAIGQSWEEVGGTSAFGVKGRRAGPPQIFGGRLRARQNRRHLRRSVEAHAEPAGRWTAAPRGWRGRWGRSTAPRARAAEAVKSGPPRGREPSSRRGDSLFTTGAVGDGTSVTSGIDVAAYVAAVALAIVAAVFSIRGMLVLFPGAPIAIIVMAAAMEVAKLVAVAWLARNWCRTGRVARTVLVVLVTGLG